MRLSIVIPACNEEQRIGPMLDAYLPFFAERYGDDVEFITVINGSTDATDDVVSGYRSDYPQLRSIIEPRRIGKGGALICGFESAEGDLVGFVDADGSTPPEAFQDLVEKAEIEKLDGAIASRWIKGSDVSPKQPFIRQVTSRIFNICIRTLFGLSFTDTQCGAKVFRRGPLMAILPHLGITRWAFDVDLLFQFRRAKARVVEFPTTWRDVEGSKLAVTEASIEMLLALVRLRLVYSPFSFLVCWYNRFFVGEISDEGAVSDKLLRHGALIMIGSQGSNVMNIAFQMVMVRMLSLQEYGTMAGMFQIIAWFGMPLAAISMTSSHFTAVSIKRGELDMAKSVIKTVVKDLGWISLAVALVTVPVYGYFVLSQSAVGGVAFVITAATLCVMLFTPVFGGYLSGNQMFGTAVCIGWVWSGTRLIVGVLLVLCGVGAEGALVANLIATLFSLSAGVQVFRRKTSRLVGNVDVCRSLIYGYAARFFVASVGLAVLMSSDIIIVKYVFGAEQGGSYAVAATVARIALFLPLPLATAMFPKVADAEGASNSATLSKALLATVLIVISVTATCFFYSDMLLNILRGAHTDQQAELVRGIAVAIAPLPVLSLLATYELARRRFGVTYPLLIGALVMGVTVVLGHAELESVVFALRAGTYTALLLIVVLFWLRRGVMLYRKRNVQI